MESLWVVKLKFHTSRYTMKKILIGLCAIGVVGYSVGAVAGNGKMHKKEKQLNRTLLPIIHHLMHKKEKQLNRTLRPIIHHLGLTGDPLVGRDVPDILTSPEAQLGMELFFSKSLGGDRDSACVTCHHPLLGGGDNLALPIGTESDEPDLLGPGRTNNEGFPPVPRNAPTTFNVIAWDKFQFHDGRVQSLTPGEGENGTVGGIRTPNSAFGVADPLAGGNLVQAQARFPVTSREEMKGFNHNSYSDQEIREFLAARLGEYEGPQVFNDSGENVTDIEPLPFESRWLGKFQQALSSPSGTAEELITEQNVSMLIGEYERSQAFANTPWKSYVKGNNWAISADAKRGAILFFTSSEQGGANCSSCHSGDFFTDESFHNLAMPQVGSGKGDSDDFETDLGSKDFGRFRETDLVQDKFAFRTPSLINVEVTGPWSHAGAYATLDAVIKHHSNADNAITNFDYTQLEFEGVSNLDKMEDNTREALGADNFDLKTLNLSDMQVGFLVEFLKTLTDPCVTDSACLAQWIPTGGEDDTDLDQLDAVILDSSFTQ